jgi:hypothetical protein
MALVCERYADFGPTLACDKLAECHCIWLAKETVRRWMRDAGLWIPRAQRPPKVYQPRARRACLGELVQIDGSDHRWFGILQTGHRGLPKIAKSRVVHDPVWSAN